MRVLIAEDQELQAELLEAALCQAGYEVHVSRNGVEAYEMVRTGQFRLLVSDWEMPGMNGVELCRKIRQRVTSGYVYVILLTLKSGPDNVVQGLDAGADDFLTKPFDPHELRVRLRNAERILAMQSHELIIFALAKLAESRDPETGAHLERIREYSRVLAERLSQDAEFSQEMDGEYAGLIYLTSPLHDIGKVGIPDRILLKPDRLTADEFAIMKQHAMIGYETLDAALQSYPEADFLTMARDIAWTHHERFDGSGYPRGLVGEEIPLCGRIVAVADVYDALTTKRVYKPAYSHEVARSVILEASGKHFDPRIVDTFVASQHQFLEIKERYSSQEQTDLAAKQLQPIFCHTY